MKRGSEVKDKVGQKYIERIGYSRDINPEKRDKETKRDSGG